MLRAIVVHSFPCDGRGGYPLLGPGRTMIGEIDPGGKGFELSVQGRTEPYISLMPYINLM